MGSMCSSDDERKTKASHMPCADNDNCDRDTTSIHKQQRHQQDENQDNNDTGTNTQHHIAEKTDEQHLSVPVFNSLSASNDPPGLSDSGNNHNNSSGSTARMSSSILASSSVTTITTTSAQSTNINAGSEQLSPSSRSGLSAADSVVAPQCVADMQEPADRAHHASQGFTLPGTVEMLDESILRGSAVSAVSSPAAAYAVAAVSHERAPHPASGSALSASAPPASPLSPPAETLNALNTIAVPASAPRRHHTRVVSGFNEDAPAAHPGLSTLTMTNIDAAIANRHGFGDGSITHSVRGVVVSGGFSSGLGAPPSCASTAAPPLDSPRVLGVGSSGTSVMGQSGSGLVPIE